MNNLPIKFLFDYSVQETSRRKCYYLLSFCACFLVALTTLIVNSLLSQSPIIFLVVAQADDGEIDISLRTSPMITENQYNLYDYNYFNTFLNFTKYKEKVDLNGINLGSTPRIELNSYGISTNSTYLQSLLIILIDTDLESSIDLGKNYLYEKLDKGKCNIDKTLANNLNINVGDFFNLTADISSYFVDLFLANFNSSSNHKQINPLNISIINVTFPCQVQNILSGTMGKTSSENRNLAFMELQYFFNYSSSYISSDVLKIFPNFPFYLSSLKYQEYATNIIANFPRPRVTTYLESNYLTLLGKATNLANALSKAIGVDFNVVTKLPLVRSLKLLSNGAIFLGLILYLTIFILFVLSIILIYSLLTITLETSSMELGILRLIGTNKKSVIYIVLMQCMLFSIPAYFFAFIIQFPVFSIFSNILKNMSNSDLKISAALGPCLLSFLLCNLAPLLASIIPIKDILSKNLSTAINTKISKTSGIKIEIVSFHEEQQNTLVTFGVLTFCYAISIYYFLPLSLLSFNLALILLIFLLILVGMLIGFIILSLNIESIVQKGFTYLFFFWTKSYIKDIIFKNLSAHKIRNRKTSLMYCLSVGFFIMITVGYNAQVDSQKYQKLSSYGAYISVKSPSFMTPMLVNDSLTQLIQNNLIKDYSYITPSLDSFNKNISSISISNEGKSISAGVQLNGVTFNLYNTTVNDFLNVENKLRDYKNTILSENLYFRDMDGNLGMSGYFSVLLGLKISDNFFLMMNDNFNNKMELLFESSFFLKNSPSLSMSSQPYITTMRNVIIPMNLYLDLMKKCSNYFYTDTNKNLKLSYKYSEIPISTLLLKVDENISSENYNKIYDVLLNDPNVEYSIWIYQEYASKIQKTSNIINLLFGFINLIVFTFCFYNLSASMSINIYEQTKEITIFRALGVSKNYLKFIYIAEAFILILSSSIVGLIIGSILSWTMSLQRVLFTNLPIVFSFPTSQLIGIFILSFIGAFICTIFPAREILNKEISEIMKLN